MKRIFLIAAASLALYGCSTTHGLSPTVSQSGFDNSTIVSISPHGGVCANFCSMIGAQWSSSDPDRAILEVGVAGYTDYKIISRADLRIAGEIFNLKPNPELTRHEKVGLYRSTKDFTVPLELIREIVKSSDSWVRIYTDDGVIDDAIISSGKDSKAYHALIRFLNEVDANQ